MGIFDGVSLVDGGANGYAYSIVLRVVGIIAGYVAVCILNARLILGAMMFLGFQVVGRVIDNDEGVGLDEEGGGRDGRDGRNDGGDIGRDGGRKGQVGLGWGSSATNDVNIAGERLTA